MWSWWLLSGCRLQLWLSSLKLEVQPVAGVDHGDNFLTCLFYSTHIPMFTVLDPLLEFTYYLLSCWRKFALCIQSLLCTLFLSGWPPCSRSDMILMEVSQRAYDMIHCISGLFVYFYVCEIYVNLIWYLYLFMLIKFCLSLSLSLSLSLIEVFFSASIDSFPPSTHSSQPSTHSSSPSTHSSLLAFLLLDPTPLQAKCTIINKMLICFIFIYLFISFVWNTYTFLIK